MSRYSKSMSDAMAEVNAKEKELLLVDVMEVSPPGFKGTVKAMKKHDEIDNPYALAWHMKNKGDEARYKNKDGRPEKKEKYKEDVDVDALHAEALQENELLNEVEWKVKLRGLPLFYVPAKSAGEIRAMLRKQIKKPDDIISIERTTPAAKKKDFRGRVQGQDSED